jgi:phosphoribosylformylglycinamidine cyclo-ligase
MAHLTYQQAGVDYEPLDRFKRVCQKLAATTTSCLAPHGLVEPDSVRGESAYLVEAPDHFLAHVEEGLGTKNLVADAMLRDTGRSFYRNIGIDTVATITNDLVTTGALPISVAMHAGVGDGAWFADETRSHDLAEGFAEGCRLSGAAWGGGETPALRGIVDPGSIVLAGSAVGRIAPKTNRIVGHIRHGDDIVLLASSGVQTNGLTLCRALASKLEDGYRTGMADGRMYGEALLDASVIYVPFVAACQKAGVRLHYAAHITGHGWRKIMRLEEPFVYRMTDVGKMPPVFRFIMERGPVDIAEAYATFNMGAGFAVYVAPADTAKCLALAAEVGLTAWRGGSVAKDGTRKAVVIEPLGITYEGATLEVR